MLGVLSLLAEGTNDKQNIYPKATELVVAAVAFFILLFFFWRWVLPRVNTLLEERREKIQGEMEKAEETRVQADQVLADYRAQLATARDEANRIIEDARATAEQLRRDIQAKAEEEAGATVVRAQEEIRAERDRAFQELRDQVAQIAVDLAGRVVNEELNPAAHERLIDEYIEQVAGGAGGGR